MFFAYYSGIIYGYYKIILKVDEEEFCGHGALLQEGIFASVTLFLVDSTNHRFLTFINTDSPVWAIAEVIRANETEQDATSDGIETPRLVFRFYTPIHTIVGLVYITSVVASCF